MAIELKPVASNGARTEPDIAEAEVANHAEVSHTWASSEVLALSCRKTNGFCLI